VHTNDPDSVLLHASVPLLLEGRTGDLQVKWNEMVLPKWDMPEEIVEGSTIEPKNGYKGHPKANRQ